MEFELAKFLMAIIFWIFVFLYSLTWVVAFAIVRFTCYVSGYSDYSNIIHKMICWWAKGLIRLTPGWSYSIKGRDNLEFLEAHPSIIVANHQSMVDIFALLAVGFQFRWISKSSIPKFPIIGSVMNWAGYVGVDRSRGVSQLQAQREAVKRINHGVSMLYFPEGTRSENGHLLEFKSGAFRVAARTKTRVLPIVLKNTRGLMKKNSLIPLRSKFEIEILAPTIQETSETVENFTARVESLFRGRLSEA